VPPQKSSLGGARGRAAHLVEVDAVVVAAHGVGDALEAPVMETLQPWVRWPPCGQAEAHDGVAGLAKAKYTARFAGEPE
jgi:hypothetical protein